MAENIRTQIKRVKKGLVEGISERIGELAFAAFSEIVIASPVAIGTFRFNWQVAILNVPKKSILIGADKSGQQTINKAKKLFANYELETGARINKIFFSDNVPYAKRLNDGHSKLAPKGFVQKAIRAGVRNVGGQGNIFK